MISSLKAQRVECQAEIWTFCHNFKNDKDMSQRAEFTYSFLCVKYNDTMKNNGNKQLFCQ